MNTYTGKGVCDAIAIGRIVLYKHRELSVEKQHIGDAEAEKIRLSQAKALAGEQLLAIYEKVLAEAGEQTAQIFEMHRMLLEDAGFYDAVINLIETDFVTAEYAVAEIADKYVKKFAAMEDSYMRERAADIRDISNRLIQNLGVSENGSTCIGDMADGDEKIILCADDLLPGETVQFEREKIAAFVTAKGSAGSHMAILARGMHVPAIVGMGDAFLREIANGDVAIADGFSGELFVHPDEETLECFAKKQQDEREREMLLQELKGKENITLDGRQIEIYANINSADDVRGALLNDAGGIGLFRSEYLYLDNSDYPSEETQFFTYKKVLEEMAGRRVIIRTLDIGADKQAGYFGLAGEENPALGYRGIRVCLTRPKVFKTQLRALYRASVYGKLGILFPMITSVGEVKKILEICEEVKTDLCRGGIAFSDTVELGIMIETPAAAVISDLLAPHVDFFSVGTNDLTQYTLAVDRQNPALDAFCDVHHEAIRRLIAMTVENAHKYGVRVGICGELAADTSMTESFLKMGVDELSVSSAQVLRVREVARRTDLSLRI